jgi:replication-associated recombination protein RarA
MIIRTVCGYDFFEVSSAMQKAIRRADTGVAGFFALELWASGYRDYVWKRLFIIIDFQINNELDRQKY